MVEAHLEESVAEHAEDEVEGDEEEDVAKLFQKPTRWPEGRSVGQHVR